MRIGPHDQTLNAQKASMPSNLYLYLQILAILSACQNLIGIEATLEQKPASDADWLLLFTLSSSLHFAPCDPSPLSLVKFAGNCNPTAQTPRCFRQPRNARFSPAYSAILVTGLQRAFSRKRSTVSTGATSARAVSSKQSAHGSKHHGFEMRKCNNLDVYESRNYHGRTGT